MEIMYKEEFNNKKTAYKKMVFKIFTRLFRKVRNN